MIFFGRTTFVSFIILLGFSPTSPSIDAFSTSDAISHKFVGQMSKGLTGEQSSQDIDVNPQNTDSLDNRLPDESKTDSKIIKELPLKFLPPSEKQNKLPKFFPAPVVIGDFT